MTRVSTDDLTISQLRRAAMSAPMLDAEAEAELLRAIQERDDRQALARLLAAHLRLVVSVAGRFSRAGLSLAELVAEGNVGLVEAARRFESEKGSRFATYAAWWVRARISRFAMGNRRIVPLPSTRNARKLLAGMRAVERALQQASGEAPTRAQIALAMGTTEDDVAQVEVALGARDVAVGPCDDGTSVELDAQGPSPEQQIADSEEARVRDDRIRRALALLDGREREIVQRRILDDEEETLASIGEVLGLSRERVRQIEVRAKSKLRAALLEVA